MNPPFAEPPVELSLSWPELALHALLVLALSTLGTWWIVRRRGRLGIDQPDGRRKLHEVPVSRLGGLPIYLSMVVGLTVVIWCGDHGFKAWAPFLICNTLIFTVGLADDLRPLGARVKLAGQFGAALILYAFGVSIDVLSNPFGEGGILLGWWSLPLTLLWLVAIPNIINLIDGMDGLAAGFGLFLSLTLAFIGYVSLQTDVMIASCLMAAALAGFLFFNLPPAKIFLGDGGAYLIGFFIASVSLKSSNKGSIIAALLVIIIALGVPILDTFFAIIRRTVRGVPVFSADAEHIHHRLILLGYSKTRALAVMYAVCLVLSLVGISILLTKGVALPIAGAVLFLLAVGAARYLGYVRSWTRLREQVRQALERRRKYEHVEAHARVLEFDAEKCGSFEVFDRLFSDRLAWTGLRQQAEPGLRPVELRLADGTVVRLHHPVDGDDPSHWVRRADCFLPVLERCQDRWGALPSGLDVVPANPPVAQD
jgi:UDP-GlcNAc:undecaprenyl-phosphate/decaprenyl-phosphate GlcNAc-1-phosphate transferase